MLRRRAPIIGEIDSAGQAHKVLTEILLALTLANIVLYLPEFPR